MTLTDLENYHGTECSADRYSCTWPNYVTRFVERENPDWLTYFLCEMTWPTFIYTSGAAIYTITAQTGVQPAFCKQQVACWRKLENRKKRETLSAHNWQRCTSIKRLKLFVFSMLSLYQSPRMCILLMFYSIGHFLLFASSKNCMVLPEWVT